MVILFRKSTALKYLTKNYYINKVMGKLLPPKPLNLGQLIIKKYPKQASLNRIKTFTGFKALLIY